MYSNTISLRYFFPRVRILNEIAEFEKMPLNRKTLNQNYGIFRIGQLTNLMQGLFCKNCCSYPYFPDYICQLSLDVLLGVERS